MMKPPAHLVRANSSRHSERAWAHTSPPSYTTILRCYDKKNIRKFNHTSKLCIVPVLTFVRADLTRMTEWSSTRRHRERSARLRHRRGNRRSLRGSVRYRMELPTSVWRGTRRWQSTHRSPWLCGGSAQWPPKRGSSRHQRAPSRPQSAVSRPGGSSTSRPHPASALASLRRRPACRWTSWLKDTPSTIRPHHPVKQWKRLSAILGYEFSISFKFYHVAVLVPQEDCITVEQSPMSRTSSFSLSKTKKNKLLRWKRIGFERVKIR